MLAAFALSLALTVGYRRVAQRKQVVDALEVRRLHRVPTVRGGGLGFVVIAIVALLWSTHYVAALAVMAVATVSLIDDWRSLGARERLVVHLLVAALVVVGIHFRSLAHLGADQVAMLIWLVHGVFLTTAALAIVWSINLHNFMDGANGLLGLSACVVLAGLAVLNGRPEGVWMLLSASALAGFLPMNFPNARVFMGDVGSASLGLLVALGVLSLWPRNVFFLSLLLPSALVIDSSLTLLKRRASTRRWYTAHRSHLYQWLIRMGYSHTRVSLFYAAWTFACASLAIGLRESELPTIFGAVVSVYLLGGLFWWWLRFHLVKSLKQLHRA